MRLKSIIIIVFLFHLNLTAQTNSSISKITIAVFNELEMVEFYRYVFGMDFQVTNYTDFKLYNGYLGDMELEFCPAHIAKNTAKQNRHQFEISVNQLDRLMNLVVKYNGQVFEEPKKHKDGLKASISDPDGNTIVLTE